MTGPERTTTAQAAPTARLYSLEDMLNPPRTKTEPATAAQAAPTASGTLSWSDFFTPKRPTTPVALGPITPVDGQTRYAATALAREVEAVAGAVKGSRNHTLNAAAFSLASLIAAGALDYATVRDTLLQAAMSTGLSRVESLRTIASGFRKGLTQPRDLAGVRELAAPNVTEVDAAQLVTIGEHVDESGQVWETFTGSTEAEPAPPVSGTAWARVDLGDVVEGLVAGTLHRATPTVAPIRGGGALFYRGKVNGLAGESGAGKTWTVLAASAGVLDAAGVVVYIDHEDDAAGIVGRLLDLGVEPDAVRARFAYFNPSEKPNAGDLQALAGLVADLRPVLVVVDSTGEGLALEGANPNADEEVAAWFLRVPRRLSLVNYDDQPGPAVVVLDHVTKADEGGLWPIGSQRKRAAISGAQYMQRTVKPFDKHTPGHAVLVCAKDRHGNYRTGQRVAELHVTPGPTITLDAVEDATASGGVFRPTGYMAKLSAALAIASAPLSRNDVLDLVPGRKDTKVQALAALVAGGYVKVTPGPRKSNLHEHVKQFTEDAESAGPSRGSVSGSTGSGSIEADPGTQWLTGSGTQSGPSGTQSADGAEVQLEACRLHAGKPRPGSCFTCGKLAGEEWEA